MMRIPGVCNGNNETTVACHSNLAAHGKGMGIKADDRYVAWGCSSCHDAIDGRSHNLSQQGRESWWSIGQQRTIDYVKKYHKEWTHVFMP